MKIKRNTKATNPEGTIIAKANNLIWNSSNTLNLLQQKLFHLLISNIKFGDMHFRPCTYSFAKIIGLLNITGKNTKEKLISALYNMREQKYRFNTSEGRILDIKVLSDVFVLKEQEKEVTMQLHEDLRPYLLGLGEDEKFVQLVLEYIMNFKSPYTLPLYEYLRSRAFVNDTWPVPFSVTELRALLSCQNKLLLWSEFKRNALFTALREIEEQTNLSVATEYTFYGKEVDSVIFKCLFKEKKVEPKTQRTKTLIVPAKTPKAKKPNETITIDDAVEFHVDEEEYAKFILEDVDELSCPDYPEGYEPHGPDDDEEDNNNNHFNIADDELHIKVDAATAQFGYIPVPENEEF